jgi:hypothetical protein
VRLDDEGRLDADEDVGCRAERLGAGDPHEFREKPCKTADDAGQDIAVVQDRHEGREEDDGREGLEGEDEPEGGLPMIARRAGRQGESAEEEPRPRGCRIENADEDVVDENENPGACRDDEEEKGKKKGQCRAPQDHPPIDGPAALRDEPGNTHQSEYAREADGVVDLHRQAVQGSRGSRVHGSLAKDLPTRHC